MLHAAVFLIACGATMPLYAQVGGGPLDPLDQWGQWRGPLATGVAPRGNPPVSWSESTNVQWKTSIPGLGHSTPIVWGDHVYVTAAVPHGDRMPAPQAHDHGAHNNMEPVRHLRFVVYAIDRNSGKIAWEAAVCDEQPHEGTHETGSWASNSPITDGESVFAFFGSRGLYCLDMQGQPRWQVDLGDMATRHHHGEGSSPALHGNTIVVNWDHQGDSFLVALDKHTGKQLWKTPRDEITSWSTPLIVEHAGNPQVVVSATKRVRGYDLATGKEIWQCAGLSRNVVASPVAGDGLVFAGNSYDWQAMLAIRLADAKGDITDTQAVVWKLDRHTPYVPSPLLYGGKLFFLKHSQGFLTCVDARSGQTLFGPQRLPGIGNVFASPVGAADRVYVVSRNGAAVVLKSGPTWEVLARNQLDDAFSASPAIAGDELYLRGERSLYCIASEKGNARESDD